VQRATQLRLPLKLHYLVGASLDLSENGARQDEQLVAFHFNGRRMHQDDAFGCRATQRSRTSGETNQQRRCGATRATRETATEQSAEVSGFGASEQNHGNAS
jgi:hypothetical protein